MLPNNYRILYKTHLVIAALVFLFFGGVIIFGQDNLTDFGKKIIPIELFIFTILHIAIAIGNKRKSNKARIASRVCGILLMPFIPIGTIFGIILFENSKSAVSKPSKNSGEMPANES